MSAKFCLFISLYLMLLSACRPDIPYRKNSGAVYGRDYTIWYQYPTSLFDEIEAEVIRSNNSLNVYNPTSVLSKVNNNEPVVLDDYFTDVFNASVEMSEKTGGIFDMTCFPLVSFWRDAFTTPDRIPEYQVDSIKQFVGYKKVRIENGRVVKDDPRIQITLTALAKGYTCNRLAALFEAHDIKNYMVDIGGVVVAKGVDQEGKRWQSVIRKPIETEDNRTIGIEEIVEIQNKYGVATSGDFKNFYVRDGKKYAHTINPITGYPAEQNILSSTIIAVNGMMADGFSTSFTAMGSEEAARLGDALSEIEYFFIYTDEQGAYQVRYSEGMRKYLLKRNEKSE